jgi:hypothetical protein
LGERRYSFYSYLTSALDGGEFMHTEESEKICNTDHNGKTLIYWQITVSIIRKDSNSHCGNGN